MSDTTSLSDLTNYARAHDVRVSVRTEFLTERSVSGAATWVYAYTITITNAGNRACQLVSRHWIITDALGEEEHVRGPGVVGQQPRLDPGEQFEYTSHCPLRTPVGGMRGTYQMVDEDGAAFDAEIPSFALIRVGVTN